MIASYALLTMMDGAGLQAAARRFYPRLLAMAHLYLNHLEQTDLQLSREVRALPQMKINPDIDDIFAFRYEDFELLGYDPHPHIKGEVSV